MMRNTGRRTLREFNQGFSSLSVPPLSIYNTHSLQIATHHPLCIQYASSAILIPVPKHSPPDQIHYQSPSIDAARFKPLAKNQNSTGVIHPQNQQAKISCDYLEGTFFEKKGRLVEGAELAATYIEESESEEDYDLGIIGMKTHTTSTIEDDLEEHNYYEEEEDAALAELFHFSNRKQHQQTSSVSKEHRLAKMNSSGRSLCDL